MSFCLKVYSRPRSKDFTTLWINSTMTPKDVIQMLRVQSNLAKNNDYGLMISKAQSKFKWLNDDEKFGRIIIDEEDEIFTQPYSKIIAVELPNQTCIKRKINVRSPIENVVKELCLNLSIYPYEIWGIYINARGENILLIPNQSISEQAPDVEQIYLKQYLFPDNLKPEFLSPLDLYILQYRSMIIQGQFGNEAEDQIFLKGKKWYNSKNVLNELPHSETSRRKEMQHLFSLKTFGSVSFIIRFHETIGEEYFHSNEKLKKLDIIRKSLYLSDVDSKNNQKLIIPFAAIKYVGIRNEFLKITFGSKEWHFISHRSSEIDVIICQLMKNYNFTIPLADFNSDIFIPRTFHSLNNQIYFLPDKLYTTEELILGNMSVLASKYSKLVHLQKDNGNEYSEEYSLAQISINTSLDELGNAFKDHPDDGSYKIDQISSTIVQARSINSSDFEDQSGYLEELKKSLLKLNELLNKETENLEYRYIKKALKRSTEPSISEYSLSRSMHMYSNTYNSGLLAKQKESIESSSISLNNESKNQNDEDENIPQKKFCISSNELNGNNLINLSSDKENDLSKSEQSENEKDDDNILHDSLNENNDSELIEEEEEENENSLNEDDNMKINQYNQTEKEEQFTDTKSEEAIIVQTEKIGKKEEEISHNGTSVDLKQEQNNSVIENCKIKNLDFVSSSHPDEESYEEDEEDEYSSMDETPSYNYYSTLGTTVIISKINDESKDDDPLSQFDSISGNNRADKQEEQCILTFPKIDQFINQNIVINKGETNGSELNLYNKTDSSTKKLEISEPESKLKSQLGQPDVQVEIAINEPTNGTIQVQNNELTKKAENSNINEINYNKDETGKDNKNENNEYGEIIAESERINDYYQTGFHTKKANEEDQANNNSNLNEINFNQVKASKNEQNKNDETNKNSSLSITSKDDQISVSEPGEIIANSAEKDDYYQTGFHTNKQRDESNLEIINNDLNEVQKAGNDENNESFEIKDSSIINRSLLNETENDDSLELTDNSSINEVDGSQTEIFKDKQNDNVGKSDISTLEKIECQQSEISKDDQLEITEQVDTITSSSMIESNQTEINKNDQPEITEQVDTISSSSMIKSNQTEINKDDQQGTTEQIDTISNSSIIESNQTEINKENQLEITEQIDTISSSSMIKSNQTEISKDDQQEITEQVDTISSSSMIESNQTEINKDDQQEITEQDDTISNSSMIESNQTEINKENQLEITEQIDTISSSSMIKSNQTEISKDDQQEITEQVDTISSSSMIESNLTEISKNDQLEITEQDDTIVNSSMIESNQTEISKDDQLEITEQDDTISNSIQKEVNQTEINKDDQPEITEQDDTISSSRMIELNQTEINKENQLETTEQIDTITNSIQIESNQTEISKDDQLKITEQIDTITSSIQKEVNQTEISKDDQFEITEQDDTISNSSMIESNQTEISKEDQLEITEQTDTISNLSMIKSNQTEINKDDQFEITEQIDTITNSIQIESNQTEISKEDQPEITEQVDTIIISSMIQSNQTEINKNDQPEIIEQIDAIANSIQKEVNQTEISKDEKIEITEQDDTIVNSSIIESNQTEINKDEQQEITEQVDTIPNSIQKVVNQTEIIEQTETESKSNHKTIDSQIEANKDKQQETDGSLELISGSNTKTTIIDQIESNKYEQQQSQDSLELVSKSSTMNLQQNEAYKGDSIELNGNTSIKTINQIESSIDEQQETNHSLKLVSSPSNKTSNINQIESSIDEQQEINRSLELFSESSTMNLQQNETYKDDSVELNSCANIKTINQIESTIDEQQEIKRSLKLVSSPSNKTSNINQIESSIDEQQEINRSLELFSESSTMSLQQNETYKDESIELNSSTNIKTINQIESTIDEQQETKRSLELFSESSTMSLQQSETYKDESIELNSSTNIKNISQIEATKNEQQQESDSLEIIDNTSIMNLHQSSRSQQIEVNNQYSNSSFTIESDDYDDESSGDLICSPLIKASSKSTSNTVFSPTKRKHETSSKLSFVVQEDEDDYERDSTTSPQSNRITKIAEFRRNESLKSFNRQSDDSLTEFCDNTVKNNRGALSMSRSHFTSQNITHTVDSDDFESSQKENMMSSSLHYNESSDMMWNSSSKTVTNHYTINMNSPDHLNGHQLTSPHSPTVTGGRFHSQQNLNTIQSQGQFNLISPSQSLQPSQFHLHSHQSQIELNAVQQQGQFTLNSPSQSLQPAQFQMQLQNQQQYNQQIALYSPPHSPQFQMQQAVVAGLPVPCFGQISSQFSSFNNAIVPSYPISPGFYSPSPAASPSTHIESSPKITVKVGGSKHRKSKKNKKKSHKKKRRESSDDSSLSDSDYSYNETSSSDCSVESESESDDECETTDQLIEKIDCTIEKVAQLAIAKKDPSKELRQLHKLMANLERKFDGTKKGNEIKKLNKKIQRNLKNKSDKKSSLQLTNEITETINTYFAEFKQFMADPLIRKSNDIIKISSNSNQDANDLSLSLLELQKSLMNHQNCSLLDQSNE